MRFRRFALALALVLALVSGYVPAQAQTSVTSVQSGRWTEPTTWDCACVPGSSSSVTVLAGHVVGVLGDVEAASLTVEGKVVVSRLVDSSVTLSGNLIVRGTLDYGTDLNPLTVNATIRWAGIDESTFVGGDTLVPLATDPGMWVMGDGRFLVRGRARLSWTRLVGAASPGQTAITLQQAPFGWKAGDDLVIAPTLPPTEPNFYDAYDYPKVLSVAGTTVVLDRPLESSHPSVEVEPGRLMTAEVLNLTRNVRVEGTTTGRAHIIFNRTNKAQRIRYLEVRWMGPQEKLGRYPLHLHKAADAARGTLVDSVSVRDSMNRAFVTHLSHGVRHFMGVSHNINDTAYWWDKGFDNGSNDVLYEKTVSSRVVFVPPTKDLSASGYDLQAGFRNTVTGAVSFGVQGRVSTAGLQWAEGQSGPEGSGVWSVVNMVSHNNKVAGWRTWQNTFNTHVVGQGSVLYYNGVVQLQHGAYTNRYVYEDVIMYGAPLGIAIHATSKAGPMAFKRIRIDLAGMGDYAIQTMEHAAGSCTFTVLEDVTMLGYRIAGIRVATPTTGKDKDGRPKADFLNIVRPVFSGLEFWSETPNLESIFVWEKMDGSRTYLAPFGADGVFRPEWNAVETGVRQPCQ